MFGFAYRAYDRADYREAKSRFGELLQTFPETRALAYWTFCSVPVGMTRMLRSAKRNVSGSRVEPLPQPEREVPVRAVFGK